MRVASYNIRKAVGLDRRRDPHRVLDVINRLDADVVVLQEADKRLGARPAALPARLIEAETDLTPVPLAGNEVSLGFHGNSILVRRGLKVSAPKRIDLPGLEPRGAVAVDVGDRLHVVGVHLGLLRRSRQAQISALLRAVADSDLPTAILGDFNEWSPHLGLEGLSHHFSVHAPGLSFHAARPVAALDRVALSDELELRHAGVEEGTLARIASDHLPIWAEIGFRPQASTPVSTVSSLPANPPANPPAATDRPALPASR